jgi:hypothetical protein
MGHIPAAAQLAPCCSCPAGPALSQALPYQPAQPPAHRAQLTARQTAEPPCLCWTQCMRAPASPEQPQSRSQDRASGTSQLFATHVVVAQHCAAWCPELQGGLTGKLPLLELLATGQRHCWKICAAQRTSARAAAAMVACSAAFLSASRALSSACLATATWLSRRSCRACRSEACSTGIQFTTTRSDQLQARPKDLQQAATSCQ